MNDYKINLLERIYAGQRRYLALGERITDYEDFIPMANALSELEHDGYIVLKDQLQETITGRRLSYEILVDRITFSGMEAIGKDREDKI